MGPFENGKGIMHGAAWICFLLTLFQCSGKKSDMTGMFRGNLRPCPDTPNCVSSQSEDPSQFIAPLGYTGSLEASQKRLLHILKSMRGVNIITETKSYLHVTVTSRFFRFVDDLEFHFVKEPPIIHVRSASRVGYFDFGVNRRRIEKIRKAFTS